MQSNLMASYDKLKELAKSYLEARHVFLTAARTLPDLGGNDNIVGRIGELVAIQFLRDQGRVVIKNTNAVQKGYDLTTDIGEQISVKVITAENKKGRTTKIKMPWSELILIKLNSHYKVDRIGIIKRMDFDKALNAGLIKTDEPYADIKMLASQGLFGKHGNCYSGKEVAHYL